MTIFHVIVLAIIEGITEFLPISSTGHLILASQILKLTQTEFLKTFEVVIQFGAICSILILYISLLKKKSYIWKKLLISLVPTLAIGFVLNKVIKSFLLGNSSVTVVALIIGGIFILIFEKFYKPKNTKTLEELPFVSTFLIGIGQTLAVIPGISRSAAAIFTAMFTGLNKDEAVEFSFLLGAPTIAAAAAFDLVKSSLAFTSSELVFLVLGCIIAFISALITIRYFIGYIKTHSFTIFGWYRIVLGLLFWFFILK